jgi:hypothetical protein|tara:strand:+ start:864 stop:1025 length:162 start_codon:yes stop_codon:yes gene_type:complete
VSEFIIPKLVNDERNAVEPIAAQPVVPINFLLEILLFLDFFPDMWITLGLVHL